MTPVGCGYGAGRKIQNRKMRKRATQTAPEDGKAGSMCARAKLTAGVKKIGKSLTNVFVLAFSEKRQQA
jgi:hypothetical protein